jgi:hypothetical protein
MNEEFDTVEPSGELGWTSALGNPPEVSHEMNLTEAIEMADEFAREELGAESNATEFMTYIASVESNYGNIQSGGMHQQWMNNALSYGPFQMDPIRYYATVQDPKLGPEHKKRIGKANDFLISQGYGENFDISKIAIYDPKTNDFSSKSERKIMHDPLINSVLTRLALMQSKRAAPEEMDDMAMYYQEFWGPKWSQSDDKNFKADMRKAANNKYLDIMEYKGRLENENLEEIKEDNTEAKIVDYLKGLF